ncbi:hypothetical protein [Nonomuraea jabiensis]
MTVTAVGDWDTGTLSDSDSDSDSGGVRLGRAVRLLSGRPLGKLSDARPT